MAISRAWSDQTGREVITGAARLSDVFQHLIDIDARLPGRRLGIRARNQGPYFLFTAARQQRKTGCGPDCKPARSLRHVEAHRRPRLKYMDILRENSVARGNDDSVTGLLRNFLQHPDQAAVPDGSLSSHVPSSVTRGDGMKLRTLRQIIHIAEIDETIQEDRRGGLRERQTFCDLGDPRLALNFIEKFQKLTRSTRPADLTEPIAGRP